LDDIIAAFASEPDEERRDYVLSFAYFNRSCYHASKYQLRPDAVERERAFRDIKLCLKTAKNPASELASMRGDPELADLVNLPEFQAIATGF
jgi:hypothetical protein